MASELDTIVAPATPLGRGALAIVRIDGPRSADILEKLSAVSPDARLATLAQLSLDGEPLDECIAIRYAAPHSFTGNDLVELTLHGSPLLVERVIAAIVECGARLAEPGEFTERAVLNGKLDLVQAESIADLINSRTALQARLSLGNLQGVLSRRAAAVRESLLHVISRLEAALDFSEEGYEFITRDDARREIEHAIADVEALAETYRRGRATTSGLTAVILGRPNAGKSTLLNRLVGSDRAIVTPIPGTTRDIVRETIEIGGLPVTIADTAGLRTSGDVVEEIGVARAREAAASADIILYLVDASAGLTVEDELASYPDAIVIYTKTDLALAPQGALGISVKAENGIDELLNRLDAIVRDEFAAAAGSLVNERQRQAVLGGKEALATALVALDAGLDEPVILVDLYRASTSLGLLTGAITQEHVFAEIFSKFCIGK
ncbi:MAG: tRNA uridine-5-carboxymethylaminomethyl(34) synthesis GTPase MnmE [Acidobacteria bacterium]|nr:tRNA uridine-5-carboxymethylaminomethyl(34) synthesis GTPase MnmE [Acidobacteriota bacterium]MBV9185220.1 tRNA uridine-5-carboxymethylaminomethyl(34) synthesis GTPase MnmE [Acidobacteriota bacterium]